jgi:polysaccharide pyruvyl transferase WcaK-like protein
MLASARQPRSVLIAHLWSDRNRGDAALTHVTIDAVRRRFPNARLALMSEFGAGDTRVLDETTDTRARYPDATIVGALCGILPISRATPARRGRRAVDAAWAAARIVVLPLVAPALHGRGFAGALARAVCPGPREREALRAMLEAEMVVCRGGGYLHGEPRLRSTLRLARVLLPLRLGQRLRVPVVLVGHSIGPFAGRWQRAMITRALAAAAWIGVREPRSAAEVHALSPELNVAVAPDLAWAIKPATSSVTDGVCAEMARHPRPWVGVSVRRWHGEAGVRAIAAVHAICSHVRDAHGGTVFAWAQSTGPSPLEDDRPLLESLAGRGSALFLTSDLGAEQLAGVYAELDAFVTMRFHGAVFAMRAGVPTLALDTWGPKLAGLMEMVDFPAGLLRADTLDDRGAVAAFDAFFEKREVVRKRLETLGLQFAGQTLAGADAALAAALPLTTPAATP